MPGGRLTLANRTTAREVEVVEPLGVYGNVDEVAWIDLRVSVEACGH